MLGLLVDFEQVIRIYVMSTYVEQRRTSTLAGVDDAVLLAAVAGGWVEAVEEAYDRHANALYRLALLIVGDWKAAEDAVVGAFIALWRAPSSVDLGERSVRGALAGKVYVETRTTHELRGHGSRLEALAALPRVERDLLALILLGEHSRRQAARLVGLNEDTAATMIAAALRATLVAGRAAPASSLGPRWRSAS